MIAKEFLNHPCQLLENYLVRALLAELEEIGKIGHLSGVFLDLELEKSQIEFLLRD